MDWGTAEAAVAQRSACTVARVRLIESEANEFRWRWAGPYRPAQKGRSPPGDALPGIADARMVRSQARRSSPAECVTSWSNYRCKPYSPRSRKASPPVATKPLRVHPATGAELGPMPSSL